jgi:hypothetical protein
MSGINVQSGDTVNVSVTQTSTSGVSVIEKPTGSASVTGVVGGGGDANYVHTQGSPSATWEVQHNLGKKPSVTVVSSSGAVVFGVVEYIDNNNVRLIFESGAFSGQAYFN